MRLILALILAGLGASRVPPVNVYVGPHVGVDGFVQTDKQIADSIADLKAAVAKQRSLRLVTDERSAHVSVYVVGRGLVPGTEGEAKISMPTTTTVLPGGTIMTTPGATYSVPAGQTHYLEVLVKAGEHERRFVSTSEPWTTGTWTRCARLLAKDLAIWIEANRERIAKTE